MNNHMIRLMSNWQETYDVLLLAHSEVMTLKAADERVRELHNPLVKKAVFDTVETFCIHCDHSYPCPTIEALDGEK